MLNTQCQGGRTWQPFVGGKNGIENFRKARIYNFRDKCVVFARNRKFAKLTQWNMEYIYHVIVGPTFGKNSQIISFFLFDSVPESSTHVNRKNSSCYLVRGGHGVADSQQLAHVRLSLKKASLRQLQSHTLQVLYELTQSFENKYIWSLIWNE